MIFLFLIILSTRAYAISMGTVVKNDFAKIEVGESANFKVLFWNIENESYKVELDKKEAPENWVIIVEPNNFNLNASVGKEYIKLPYENDYVKATPVDIIVKPANSTNPGKYDIVVIARASLPSNEIGFSQERLFKFVVEINNPLFFEDSKKQNQNIYQNKENQDTSIEINLSQENVNFNYFYITSILLILLISFLIYKYF
jgi:hypothetical protein